MKACCCDPADVSPPAAHEQDVGFLPWFLVASMILSHCSNRLPNQAWLGLCLALVAFVHAGCDWHTTSKAASPEPGESATVPVVKVITAKYQTWPRVARVQGSLHGDEESVI